MIQYKGEIMRVTLKECEKAVQILNCEVGADVYSFTQSQHYYVLSRTVDNKPQHLGIFETKRDFKEAVVLSYRLLRDAGALKR